MKRNDTSMRLKANSKNIYDIKRPNGIKCIHNNEVNDIAEQNLLHDIINPYKGTKNINSY